MKSPNRALLAGGLVLLLVAVTMASLIETPTLRYAGSLTAAAIGLGLLRRAFRVE